MAFERGFNEKKACRSRNPPLENDGPSEEEEIASKKDLKLDFIRLHKHLKVKVLVAFNIKIGNHTVHHFYIDASWLII